MVYYFVEGMKVKKVIKFKNVTKRYANNIAVDNVSFNIKEGEFLC